MHLQLCLCSRKEAGLLGTMANEKTTLRWPTTLGYDDEAPVAASPFACLTSSAMRLG